MPLETEVRFRIPTELIHTRLLTDPLVTQVKMREFKDISMVAEYYDSPGHALQGMKATLRHRLENGISHVSFKMSVPSGSARLLSREKWECEADDVSLAIGILRDMGAPAQLSEVARNEGFLARGRFDYVRRSVPLMLPESTVVELNVDRGSLSSDGKQESMLEVVLKLLYGDPAHLEEFAQALEQKYELPRELSSKYERVLRLLRSRR